MPGKKTEKSLKDAPMPPLPFANKIKKVGNGKAEKLTVPEMLNQIDEMYKIHDQISKMLDEILQKTGWSRKFLETYLSNPNNFTPKQWESLNRQRRDLMKSIGMPIQVMEGGKKGAAPVEKERRKKNVGARRNWLPM